MNTEEMRAITAQGPSVILVEREHLLRLIDDNAEVIARNDVLEHRNRALCVIGVGSVSLWLWYLLHGIVLWIGAP